MSWFSTTEFQLEGCVSESHQSCWISSALASFPPDLGPLNVGASGIAENTQVKNTPEVKKERFLIGPDRAKCANIRGSPLGFFVFCLFIFLRNQITYFLPRDRLTKPLLSRALFLPLAPKHPTGER